jgi:DNA-binding Lrp family transcriptional regulator
MGLPRLIYYLGVNIKAAMETIEFIPLPKGLNHLDPESKSILYYLCSLVDLKSDRLVWPSIIKIAENSDISKPTVISRLKKLEDLGVIKKYPGSRVTPNKYKINYSGRWLKSLPSKGAYLVKEVNSGGKSLLPEVVKEVASTYNKITYNNLPIIDSQLSPEENFIKRINEIAKEMSNKPTENDIKNFCDYWTEKNPNGKKMRFEKQKVFDPKKRLATWMRNKSKFATAGKKEISKPDSLKEILMQCKEMVKNGFDAKFYFDFREKSNWIKKNGQPVTDWMADAKEFFERSKRMSAYE